MSRKHVTAKDILRGAKAATEKASIRKYARAYAKHLIDETAEHPEPPDVLITRPTKARRLRRSLIDTHGPSKWMRDRGY